MNKAQLRDIAVRTREVVAGRGGAKLPPRVRLIVPTARETLLAALRSHPGHGFSPTELAKISGFSRNHVEHVLGELVTEKQARRVGIGVYASS